MKENENRGFPHPLGLREGWVVSTILGLAFAIRLYLVFHTYLITNDGVVYIRMSKLISQGDVGGAFSLLFFNLYPLITVLFQKVFHDWELSAQMVSAVFGSLTIIPFYFLVRALFNRTVALTSSILLVFHPYLVRFSAEVIRGPAFWFCFMTALWLGWEALCRRSAWLFFLTGLSGVLSFLLRPEGILVVPLVAVWVFLKDWKEPKSTYKERVFLALVLLFAAPIVLSPGILYIQKKTGRWHLARVEEIPRLVFSDITAKSVKRNFEKIEVKAGADSPQEKTELIRLRQFLSLALDHRVGVVALEMLSKFHKAIHPLLLVLLLFGVVRRGNIPYRREEELFLLSALALSLLVLIRYGTVTFYIGTRHMMVPVILCLAWAGAGVVEIEHKIRNLPVVAKTIGKKTANLKRLRWALVGVIVFALLPKTLASQRIEKMPIRQAGVWIKENGPKNPTVVGQGDLARIGFYAEGTFFEIPRDQELNQFLRQRRVDFLAINQRDIANTHPGLIDSLDSERFKREVVFGVASGPYVITIYSVGS